MDSPRKDKIVTKTSGSSLLLDLHQISKIFAWGEGKEGTLGHGESTNSTSPQMIGGFDNINFTSVSAGLYHSVAISVDGKLYSWGRGENGRLGHGDVLTRFRPKAIEFQQADTEVVPIDGIKFRVVSAGYHHNVAIDSEGNLYSWGSGWSGQLGHTTTDDIKRPMLILSSSVARSTSSNAVVGKTVVSRSSALQVSDPEKRRSLKESLKNDADSRFATAAAGFHHSLAITESGKLYSWGFGEHGQLGHGDKKRVSKPRAITAAKDITFKQVSASEYHSIALSTDGKIYAWGWGEFGELGQGTDNKQVSVPTPVLVRGNAQAFKAVAAGAYLSVALCNDGHLYTAGRQLRERSPFNYEFTKMEGAGHLRFVQVSAKNNHVLLLSEDSTIYSWGHNTVGQLGYEGEGDLIPKPVSSPHFTTPGVAVLQVSAGGNHSLALAKVPLELSNNISQSQGSPSLSSSTSQLSMPLSVSKSAPTSPAAPQSRVRSQQLVLAMLESSTEATQSKGRDRSYTVEVSSPRSPRDTDLESSSHRKEKEKREKKRSKSKLEDSGSRTSRPRLEDSSAKKSSKQHSKGEIMTNSDIQSKINDLMAKQHEAIKAEQKLLKQKEEILKKETKLKQDMSDIENSLKMYLAMLMAKLNNTSGSRMSIGPISEKQ